MSDSLRRFRVVVVDDEATARAGISQLVAADPELEVVAECATGEDAVESVIALEPDLMLLDIQMPRTTGFDVVREVGVERMPLVVFVTAYDQFALEAFGVHAFDYLLKPFDDERFAATMSRAKVALRQVDDGRLARRLLALLNQIGVGRPAGSAAGVSDNAASTPATPISRLVIRTNGRVTLLAVQDIDWIEAADYCVRVHAAGRSHLIRESMASLEARLDERQFFRTHRSAIVNLDRIQEIQPSFRGEHVIILGNRTRIPLSRPRRAKLEALLHQLL